jgi:hypothetical protein
LWLLVVGVLDFQRAVAVVLVDLKQEQHLLTQRSHTQ